MQCTRWILFLLTFARALHCLLAQSEIGSWEVKEYCDHDGFHPVCGGDEIIIIKHARYGRMRIGRCIPGSADTIGCSMDVRNLLDRTCSGRRSCQVLHIASIAQEYNSPCGADLREYLEAAYECVQVSVSENEDCGRSGAIELQSQHGFLSSSVTQETGCGSRTTPWWISVETGQTIIIRLFDFGASDSKANTRPGSNVCQVYAIVKEPSAKREESVCASTTRETVVYTSVTDRVEVRLITGTKGEDLETHFVLEYTAIGCPDLRPPVHGWIKRRGDDADIGCDQAFGSEITWTLHCEDTKWVGEWRNCTAGAITQTPDEQVWIFPDKYQVLSIMVIIGIVISVCLCILLVAVIYVKRNWNEDKAVKSRRADIQTDGTKTVARQSLLTDGPKQDYHFKDDDYYGPGSNSATTRTTYPPPPYFNGTAGQSSGCTCQRHTKEHENGYERSVIDGQRKERRGRGGDRKYYELDPDYIESC